MANRLLKPLEHLGLTRNTELSRKLELLNEINIQLAAAFDEEELMRLILSQGLKLVECKTGALYLSSADGTELQLKAKSGFWNRSL